MSRKVVFTLVAMSLATFFLSDLSAAQETAPEDLKQFYGSIIDEMSSKCKYKTEMRDSRREKIRNASAISYLKNTYWSTNKESLIEEMCKENFERDRGRALAFLNIKFQRTAEERDLNLHTQTPLEALPEKPVNEFEKMKIGEFCRYYCIPAGLFLSALEENGFSANEDATIGQIAEQKGMSAEEVYRVVKRKAGS